MFVFSADRLEGRRPGLGWMQNTQGTELHFFGVDGVSHCGRETAHDVATADFYDLEYAATFGMKVCPDCNIYSRRDAVRLTGRAKCGECEGDGFLYCDLGHEHRCDACDGSGKVAM